MFVDEVTIEVQAGKGGDGVVTFRREKYVPRGGPSGGKGGRGGDVYLVADNELMDLSYLALHHNHRAGDGGDGGKNNMTGADGEDIFIRVPVGVTISLNNKDNFLADLVVQGQELLIARGGRGGLGNARFANSRRQTPHIATAGESGEKFKLIIELKVLADVGLVGMPNAGKSTLLGAISHARPKVGDYPFTTLEPSLGVVETKDWQRFTVADIPGLIEGAFEGKGLGHEFLKHIERCRVLIYLVDLSSEHPVRTLQTLWEEVRLYNEETFAKPAFIVGNKIDLVPNAPDTLEEFANKRKIPYFGISAKEKIGLDELLIKLLDGVKKTPLPETRVIDEIYLIKRDDEVIIEEVNGEFVVKNSRLERIMAKTDYESFDGRAFIERQLRRAGVEKRLKQMGVKDGDVIIIGGKRFVFQ